MTEEMNKFMNKLAHKEFTRRDKKKKLIPKREIVSCDICYKDMEFFTGIEVLRVCSHCRAEARAFQIWEQKNGKFTGWKLLKEWETRYDN